MLSGPDDFRVLRLLISRTISSELVGEKKMCCFCLERSVAVINVCYRLLKFFLPISQNIRS